MLAYDAYIRNVKKKVAMACQKVCKQSRDDIKVKVNIYTKPYPYTVGLAETYTSSTIHLSIHR